MMRKKSSSRPNKCWGANDLIFIILVSMTIMSGVVGIVMRLTGLMSGIDFLYNALVVQAWYLISSAAICTIIILKIRELPLNTILFMGCFLILIGIMLFGALFPITPSSEHSWNTAPFEMARALVLNILLLAIMVGGKHQVLPTARSIAAMKLIIVTAALMVIVSVGQITGKIPYLFFMWFGKDHLGRPSGGLEHPHFYAIFMIISLAAIFWLKDNRVIKFPNFVALNIFMVFGVVISTSRIGMAMTLVFYVSYYLYKNRNKLYALFSKLVLALILTVGMLFVASVIGRKDPDGPIGKYVTAFYSEFEATLEAGAGDGEFLNGRGAHWEEELEVIKEKSFHFWLGYGYQPYVSHNQALRQAQVSGVLGLTLYSSMIFFFFRHVLGRSRGSSKALVFSLMVCMLMASITFPIFISVTATSALTLLFICLISEPRKMSSAQSSVRIGKVVSMSSSESSIKKHVNA